MADVRDEKLAKRIGLNISNWLIKNDKTQTDLCNDFAFSRSTISSWVNGVRMPKEDKLRIIAGYLGCTLDDLMYDPKEARRKQKSWKNIGYPIDNIYRIPYNILNNRKPLQKRRTSCIKHYSKSTEHLRMSQISTKRSKS